MTVHLLVGEQLRAGQPLAPLVDAGQLNGREARRLAEAMVKDTVAAVAASGGDLLISHPAESGDLGSDSDVGAELRAVLAEVLEAPEAVRSEEWAGGSAPDRIEHACRHLLEDEDAASVAVLDGRAPTLHRTELDEASMKLRRSEVVVGPGPSGRVTYLGLSEPLTLDGLDWPFALEALVERAAAEGRDVDFLELQPWVRDTAGLETVVSLIGARRSADRRVPEHTAAAIGSLEL